MQTSALLIRISNYCERARISESTFGIRVANDGKLVPRLRAGRTITLATCSPSSACTAYARCDVHGRVFVNTPGPGRGRPRREIVMQPSVRHRAHNVMQSALLAGGMAVIAWAIFEVIAGPVFALSLVLMALAGMLLAPRLPKSVLLSAHGARPLSARDFPEGVAMLAELARRAGLPRVPALCYVPNCEANAFALGSPEDSAVCISDGLLRLVDRRELAGVLAHEVAHIAHRDLWIMGLADALSRAVTLAAWAGQFLILLNLPLFLSGAAHLPWHVPILLVFSPAIMALMQLALSRTREFDADLGAAALTGDPAGLASAILKLERRKGRLWEIFLPHRRIPDPSFLRTHPRPEDRVARLLEAFGHRPAPPRPAPPRRVADPFADPFRLPVRPEAPGPRPGRFGRLW
jgi:heat shock protein HtpX